MKWSQYSTLKSASKVAFEKVDEAKDDDGAVATFEGDAAALSDMGIVGQVADVGGDAGISLIDLNGLGLV